MRCKGTTSREMRQKSIAFGIGAGGLVSGAVESEAEGSAFLHPHHLGFLLLLLVAFTLFNRPSLSASGLIMGRTHRKV